MNKAFEKNLEIEKIKVASAEIVVHGTYKKPYYEIRYYDISDGKYHIGYSSYDLSIVFGWLKECFEIVHEIEGEYTSTEHINCSTNTSTDTSNNDWIPCSERLPGVEADVLLSLRSLDIHTGFMSNTEGYFYVEGEGYVEFENVLAWQSLPEPFKERD